MKARVVYQEQPLQSLQFQGLHLIEASAGTGKTWTLSSLMVRILTEKYMPRQVIATTFTRAAAAELKSRIRKRLLEIYHAALIWQDLSPVHYSQTLATLNDPLQQVIFRRFQYNEQHDFQYLVNRLKLVIDSLDELFVGTIDSFIQKLLREFSFDSGEILPRQMSDDEQQYSYQLVHDLLRQWLQKQPQYLIDLLLFTANLKTTEDYVATVQQTLNFSQVKLQQVACPEINIQPLEETLQQLIHYTAADFSTLKEFYHKDGKYHKFANKNVFVETRFTKSLPGLIEMIRSEGGLVYLNTRLKNPISEVDGIFLTKAGEPRSKILNKCSDDVHDALYNDKVFQTLQTMLQLKQEIRQQLNQLDQYIRYYLSVEVKKQLPQLLLQAGETTFNQQTRTLCDALINPAEQRLARAIQQRYPMILVDEFQDTNQEQDNILQSIWRDPQRLKQSCFIAVGDPKQAIYGFRGGDMLTYINAFNDIASKQGFFYRLSHNFRSIPRLVQAVDALFMRQPQFGENIEYYPAQCGVDDDDRLIEAGHCDQTPLRWIQLEEGSNENEAFLIAQKIRYLLALSQQGQLYFSQKQEQRALLVEDIAVLAASNRELDQVQQQLERLNIRVHRTALNSVFESSTAQDLGALLQAIVHSENESILKRALLTPAIGLTLTDFCQFEIQAELMSQHMQRFRQTRQIWLQKGFLIAWQFLCEIYQVWQNLAQNSAEQAERQIVNLRHLVELLSQHSRHYQGIQHLIQWYQLQLGSPSQREWELERKLSSESGVQLMTIHKSKGLEFRVVFLMYANKDIKIREDGLAFYAEKNATHQQSSRVIALSPKLIRDNAAAQLAHQDKITGENHRLWYVALTRASYRLYVVLHHQNSAPQIPGGVAFWRTAQTDAFSHVACLDEPALSPAVEYQARTAQTRQLQAVPYPAQQFYPKTRTSFSYLAAHLKHRQAMDALAAVNQQIQGAEDEKRMDRMAEQSVPCVTPLVWIRQYFPRGTMAGNCLHEIFEVIDFQQSERWEKEIRAKLYHYGLWQTLLTAFQQDFPGHSEQDLLQQITDWINEILYTPLRPDHHLCLKELEPAHRLAEFPFFLALADQRFDTAKIHQLFLRHGIVMPEFEHANSARYLNGAIDLIYFDGQRYHIADYKSNYLGDHLEHYHLTQIEQNMSMSSYWLQASIYLLALHRYLMQHLAGYVPVQHLGGASYLYLRGMCGQAEYAVNYWQPDLQLIMELDQLLGQSTPRNPACG